jgi:hypothetical protein
MSAKSCESHSDDGSIDITVMGRRDVRSKYAEALASVTDALVDAVDRSSMPLYRTAARVTRDVLDSLIDTIQELFGDVESDISVDSDAEDSDRTEGSFEPGSAEDEEEDDDLSEYDEESEHQSE